MESATAEILRNYIKTALFNAGLSINQMMTLGMDGPNVNKTVFNLINQEIIASGRQGLINIGSCNLHTIHNTFLEATKIYGTEAIKLMVDVYSWFHTSSAR